MIYNLTIYPIECFYKVLYLALSAALDSYGLALVFLSVVTYILMRPLMTWAEKFQADEKNIQAVLAPQLAAIKENFSGAERHKKIQRLYKRYAYHPALAIRSAAGIMLQLPFLMAAYFMLDNLTNIVGESWWIISDLSSPDGLLGGINFLPILMTVINLVGAFFVKNFSRRDKMQASVIAFLFLILLYDMPSALLIYWTCNNLWTTCAILFGAAVPKIFVSAQTRLKKFLSDEFIPLSFSLTLCVFIPLDIYLTNAEEIWFSAKDIFPYTILGAALSFILLCLCEKFLPAKVRKYFQAAIFGLTVGFFMQSYVFNPNYKLVDFVQANWENYSQENFLNLVIWIYFLLVLTYFLKKYSAEKILATGKTLCVILVAVQIFSLCCVEANNSSDKRDYNVLTTANLLNVSSKDNIIVLILDAFDERTFEEINQNEPELVSQLEGFTFYPDAVSIFGATDWSMPQMLTGKAWDNSQSYSDYVQEAWDSSKKFYDILREHNYDISIYTGFHYVAKNAPVDNLLNQEKSLSINRYTLSALTKLTLFRCLPNYLKPNFIIESAELWRQEEIAGDIQPYSESNYFFYSQLQKGLSLQDKKNSFRWYHVTGAHFPFRMTRDIKPTPNGEETTRYEQSVGALKIALTYLQQMRELKIYDNSTILILADHGDHEKIFNNINAFNEFKPLPLVLVKQPDEHGALKVSENPISYSQLQATLLKRFPEGKEFGEDFSELLTQSRFFRLVSYTSDRTMTEYAVAPKAWDNSSWHEAKILSRKYINDQNYNLGTSITSKNVESYMTKGWRLWPDINCFLTDGVKAEMLFHIKNLIPNENLKIKIIAYSTQSLKTDFQKVDVCVNNSTVATWEIGKTGRTYEAVIPYELIDDTKLKLSFIIREPIAYDTIVFFQLVIDYDK
ncbi:MAG: YidC/Oxa1 family membrane protein insertase [Selenomonadaceae bacterium]|nr:YidC/Oxa1 family membrane protein insertase [Selenomonadaceae bacterium]MBQ9497740.1 YidC/Oxa1 family membrane protein insertase [Selenomonadaceae bacterium]